MIRRSGTTIQGGSADSPDFLWYNADIVNNNQIDAVNGIAIPDPQVRFNEQRDKPILYNIQDYHFSIVRFSMNGANLDLPLWCPQVALNVSYPYWVSGTQYNLGDNVSYNVSGTINQYTCTTANLSSSANAPPNGVWTLLPVTGAVFDSATNTISTVYSFTMSYQQQWNTNLGVITIGGVGPETFLVWIPQIQNTVVGPPPLNGPIYSQNLSSRWWWATDYSYVVGLMNTTLIQAWSNVWDRVFSSPTSVWNTYPGLTTPNPYPTLASFLNGVGAFPQLVWNAGDTQTHTITLYADSDCFGQRLTSFTNATTAGTPSSVPYCRIFTNNNMYGLLSGFSSLYWNTTTVPPPTLGQFIAGTPSSLLPGSTWTLSQAPALTGCVGCTNEIIVTNAFYSNVQDYRLTPYSGTPPLGYVPTASSPSGVNLQKVYWAIAQDFACVDTMWSPIASLVFTSQFIPVTKEVQSDPTYLGGGNLGNSTVTSPSAFQPIVGDVEIDLADKGADAYRGFIKYEPQAEFRMSDIAAQNDLRAIDIQLWWKGRLDGQLYPVNMFNMSSVSIKMLFRKKGAVAKYTNT